MIIIPAILTKTCEETLTQIETLRGVAPWVQIDVMDGTLVPGHTFDLVEIAGRTEGFDVEVHLMVDEPTKYFDACNEAGARRVYFHIEAKEDVREVIHAMDEYGFEKGIVINPDTSIETLEPYMSEVDALQIMTIEPGAQGRALMLEMLARAGELRREYPDKWLSVDGGVNEKTLESVVKTGIDAAGMGSAISGADDPAVAFARLQEMAM